jgi:hypothetical protein
VGGVGVNLGSKFTMNGGTISGNTGSSCGGVYISTGTFTKSGGVIADNIAPTAILCYNGKRREDNAGTTVKLYANNTTGTWSYNDTSEGGVGDTTAEWVD